MPLSLVTGPANAEKARRALETHRANAPRGGLLVVPRPGDVELFRRELAADGDVFGASVMAFDRLLETIAARVGVRGRPLGPLARERLAAAVASRVAERGALRALEASARTPGFPAALLRLVDELEERRLTPARWWRALRQWAHEQPGRAEYAEDLGALNAAYRDALERLGRTDPALHAVAALDGLRLAPARWGGTPVVLYGFDDLTPIELDAVESLALHADADVLVTLTYEPGRAAFGGRGEAFHALEAVAARHERLPARADHYAAAALHHLERGLFEEDAGRVDAAGAVELLEGGGERAELELVARRVRALLDDGVPAEEIAVVLRSPAEAGALVDRVFAAAGVRTAVARDLPAGHTALGRALAGLVRAALAEGSAADLLAWLRAPGHLDRPALADGLEEALRREGVTTAAAARARWERDHPTFPLEVLDRVRDAAERGPRALRDRLGAELLRLLAAPHRRQAAILRGAETLDARVAAALRRALDELAALAAADGSLWPAPGALADVLAAVPVPAADRAVPGAVLVASPLALRARRVRALFLCRLQEGTFPAPARPEPFLADADRRALNSAAGLRLRLHEDALDRERYLLYAAVSRPTEHLALSWHAADDDGAPRTPSLFLADIRDRFTDELWTGRARRPLGAVDGHDPADRPGAVERPIVPLGHPEVLAAMAAQPALSASALETWAGCPVRWFVERFLRPNALDPDPEALRQGGLAHEILEEVLRELCAGGRALTPERLSEARTVLERALERRAGRSLSVSTERSRSHLRRVEADVWRELERHAYAGGRYVPTHFELTFGGSGDEHPAVALAGGALPLRGRIDRVDVAPEGGRAIVVDYKGRSAQPTGTKWAADGRLQVGLYLLALERLLGLEPAGGFYQSLGGKADTPRGLVRDDAGDGLATTRGDRVDPGEFARVLAEVEAAAVTAAGELRRGALRPQPGSCAYRGGCAHPSICRCEAA